MHYVNTVSKLCPASAGSDNRCGYKKLFGSISHSTSTALAVVSTHPVGLDIEAIFTPQTAVDLTGGIIDNREQRLLQFSLVPFPLALTLAFSAKESVYKTFSAQASELPGFASAKIVALTATHLTVQITPVIFAKPRRTGILMFAGFSMMKTSLLCVKRLCNKVRH